MPLDESTTPPASLSPRTVWRADATDDTIPLWKRSLDIAIGLAVLLLILPPVTLIVVAMQCTSPGPLLFRQPRVGFKRRPFDCLKFRTMRQNASERPHAEYVNELIRSKRPLEKLDASDPRLLPGARFLRATGLDELPQIINVLRGEMSIVGPRPCLACELEHCEKNHLTRFDTHPGLTGLWQVSGKNRTTFEQMLQLDVSYARRRTLVLDLKILAQTVPTLVQQVSDLRERSRRSRAGIPVSVPSAVTQTMPPLLPPIAAICAETESLPLFARDYGAASKRFGAFGQEIPKTDKRPVHGTARPTNVPSMQP